jgi:hypothetical protein
MRRFCLEYMCFSVPDDFLAVCGNFRNTSKKCPLLNELELTLDPIVQRIVCRFLVCKHIPFERKMSVSTSKIFFMYLNIALIQVQINLLYLSAWLLIKVKLANSCVGVKSLNSKAFLINCIQVLKSSLLCLNVRQFFNKPCYSHCK